MEKNQPIYFDVDNWGFRALRSLDVGGATMSAPSEFWNDAHTTICENRISIHELVRMIPVHDVEKFELAYFHVWDSRLVTLLNCESGAWRVKPWEGFINEL